MSPFLNARPARLAAALVFASCVPAGWALPVISEIMYRPGTGFPENTALEYVEVHNPDAAAIDIGGWAFRSGVNFTFAANTLIPSGGHVVVAANPQALQVVFGSINALGPWQAGNTLSNNGEKITLSMPDAVPGTWIKVDEVSYSSEGDWAPRTWNTSAGWDWNSPANGGGKSLELRNPALSNDNGQNWAASTASIGTPGAPNTVNTTNLPPVIHAVKHSPGVPTTTQSVTISCEVNDEAAPEARTATLLYRNATSGTVPGFSSVPMTNDGTGKLRAVLAAFPVDKTIIEFYISSGDGTATRTWPAPVAAGQTANCQFQVDNEVPSTTAETYRLTMTAAENTAFNNISNGSDQQFNQTLIIQRGSESTIRYRAAMRIRGNSSRSYTIGSNPSIPVRPLRVSVPADDPLDGVTRFNLNPKSSYLQYFGMKCVQAAGLRAPDVLPVELRRNGVELTTSTNSTPDYGRWVRMEDFGSEMADNQWPEASTGNFYKKKRPDWYWRSGIPAPSNPDGTIDGWSKQNNGSANDWSDLTTFLTTVQSITAPHFPGSAPNNTAGADGSTQLSGTGSWASTIFDSDQMEQLDAVADTAQWARWFAVMTILQSNETNVSNGQDDDYGCYFLPAPGGLRRMQLLPHDLDTIFGKGDNTASHGLYDATAEGSVFRPLLPLMGNNTTPGNAAWRASYHTAIREMCGTVFNPATFPAFVEYHLGTWVPPNIRTDLSNFIASRNTTLLSAIGAGAIAPPAPTSTSTLVQAHGPLVISEVLAANASAHQHDGVYPDVIEIQNTGSVAINLGGKSISDDPAQPQKFMFAAGTMLNPGAFLVLYADSNFAGTGLHTGFSLDQSGDTVVLFDTVGSGGGLLDSITLGPQATDFSVGRSGAGLNTLTICTPTIGAANTAVVSLGLPGVLRINEWFTNPDFRFDDDFVEIHNGGTTPVAMGGMRLTDDVINYPSQHTLPPLSFIGPGGFHVFKAKGSNATPDNPSELPFSLNSTFDGVTLLGSNGSTVDRVDTVAQNRDQSTGRNPDSAATFASFTVPSPGLSNSSVPAGYAALLNSLRITEIMYKPNGGNDFEFVELLNTGGTNLNLAGVRFTSGVDYTFPTGVTLAPGAYIVVCRNRQFFLDRFPGAAVVLAPGQYSGALDNSGETLTLSLPNPWDVAIVNFRYETDWEPLTFSGGYSLTAANPAGTFARDYNERESWTSSPIVSGTPGSEGPPSITSTLVSSVIAGDVFSYTITASRAPFSYSATPLPAGLTVNNLSGVISGTPTVSGVFNVNISATNTSGTDAKTLVLTVASSGPLHHFTWGYTPATAEAGRPFPALITARDAENRVVNSFSGPVGLSATAASGGTSSSSVYVMELCDEGEDQFELQNPGTTPVNTTGWFVVAGNSASVNQPQSVTWSLPALVSPGEILRVSGKATPDPGVAYFGSTISWTALLKRGWILLVDGGGTVRDFFVWGWTEEDLEGVTITARGFTISLDANWSGDGATIPASRAANNTNSFQRIGSADTNLAGDWVFSTGVTSWGTTNNGLAIPWEGALSISLSPSFAAFNGGVFAGYLTVGEAAAGVTVTAADSQAHMGQSSAFDVIAASADTDNDKMPDAWESANGLNPSAAADAAADADGDGFSNLTEYYGGTDPRSAASKLAVTSWSAVPPSQVSLAWSAQAGRLYRIRYGTALNAWSYVPGQAFAPAASGITTATFAPPAGAGERGYYQVELVTP